MTDARVQYADRLRSMWMSMLEAMSQGGLNTIYVNPMMVDDLRAAEVLARRDWQTIETAPQDGTRVLLWWRTGKDPHVGRWEIDDLWEERRWAHKAMKEGWRCDGDACIPTNQKDCTHWMPLPSGPRAPLKSAQGEAK